MWWTLDTEVFKMYNFHSLFSWKESECNISGLEVVNDRKISASVNNMLDLHLSEEMCCLKWYCKVRFSFRMICTKLTNLSWLHNESIDTVSGKLVISQDFLREFGGVRGGPTWMWLGTGTYHGCFHLQLLQKLCTSRVCAFWYNENALPYSASHTPFD